MFGADDADRYDMGAHLIHLRYSGTCSQCTRSLAASERGWWDSGTKAVRCETCGSGNTETQGAVTPAWSVPAGGVAGASAWVVHDRRQRRDDSAVLSKHPLLGQLLVAARGDRPSTKVWAVGAVGEERVGARLDQLAVTGAKVLHDLRIPGSRANIDHIVVAPSGVWVIDAKHYRGKVGLRNVGGPFRPDFRLYVNGRDRTNLAAGMAKQVDAVRSALNDRVPIHPVLCFTGAEWSVFSNALQVDGVLVTWPRALARLIRKADGSRCDVDRVAHDIAENLPVAC